jgi:hypothetical protein
LNSGKKSGNAGQQALELEEVLGETLGWLLGGGGEQKGELVATASMVGGGVLARARRKGGALK